MSDGLEALRLAQVNYDAGIAEGADRHCDDCGALRPLAEFRGNLLFADGFGPVCERHRLVRWHAGK